MSEAAALAVKLEAEGQKSALFFGGLEDQQWNVEVYTEGAIWTIRSILAHLMSAERSLAKLFENIRQGGPGVSDDFVIDRFNARQQEKTKNISPMELLEQYKTVRAELVAWVSGLSDSDLGKTGRHPWLGVTTLREMVKMVYVHNQIHYRDVRRVLRGYP